MIHLKFVFARYASTIVANVTISLQQRLLTSSSIFRAHIVMTTQILSFPHNVPKPRKQDGQLVRTALAKNCGIVIYIHRIDVTTVAALKANDKSIFRISKNTEDDIATVITSTIDIFLLHKQLITSFHLLDSAPGRIRTYDQQIRSLLLYPLSYGGISGGTKQSLIPPLLSNVSY